MINILMPLISPIVSKVIDFIGQKAGLDTDSEDFRARKLEADAELQKALLAHQSQFFELAKAQIEVNKVEAASNDKFKSRWRPAVGWVCVTALGYHTILLPLFQFIGALIGTDIEALPAFDLAQLSPILMGMLGLGALRTIEKVKKK